MTTWHKIKLNCHVFGFDIGCHEAIIMVTWILFVTSTKVVLLIEFLSLKSYNGFMTANVKTNLIA